MPLARHDQHRLQMLNVVYYVSTHMPLARHDRVMIGSSMMSAVSTHMPLARHDGKNRDIFVS